jgi:hypothetical protein
MFVPLLCGCKTEQRERTSASDSEDSRDTKEWLFTDPSTFDTLGDAEWDRVNDEWVANIDSGAGFLMTKGMYKNFDLTVEFKPDSSINSGIFIRCANQELSPEDCYELNIWDLHPNQEYRTGAVVMRAAPLNYVATIDKWNSYKVVVRDNHIVAWINEELVIDITDDSRADGYIGIQAAGSGTIRFRNIWLTSMNETTN